MDQKRRATLSEINTAILLSCEEWAKKYLSEKQPERQVDWQQGDWGDPLDSSEGEERRRLYLRVKNLRRRDKKDASWVQDPAGWREQRLLNRWNDARRALESVIVENRHLQRTYCHLPPVALPGKKPQFLIRNPDDLTCWLLARMLAGHQWSAIVKCTRCDCFGAHKRARPGMKYCGQECLADENRDSVLKDTKANRRRSRIHTHAQFDRLEKEIGILARSLRIERLRMEEQKSSAELPIRTLCTPSSHSIQFRSSARLAITTVLKQQLTFARKLQHINGLFKNVWYCQKCFSSNS